MADELTVEQIGSILAQMQERFRGVTSQRVASDAVSSPTLHGLVERRRAAFHALREAEPVLPAPFDEGPTVQTDAPRRLWTELKARLTENPYTITVRPARESAALQKLADDVEKALNILMDDLEERLSLDIAGDLADGVIIDAFGVLHWRLDTSNWPAIGEAATLDEMPQDDDLDDATERARKTSVRERYEEYDDKGRTRYRETDSARLERLKMARAKAGMPFFVEVLSPRTVYWIDDRKSANGMAMVATIRDVPYLTYHDELSSEGLSLRREERQLLVRYQGDEHVGEQRDRPAEFELSDSDIGWRDFVTVAVLWDRERFYEVARLRGSAEWTLVKSAAHPYGMPPFAFAWAERNGSADPALAYEPALEGVYRVKELVDREQALFLALAEMVAIPVMWIEMSDGTPMLDAEGKTLLFSRESLSATTLPDGAKIQHLALDISQAFVNALQLSRELLSEAAPSTGRAEFGVSTQPWTARLQQAQENVQPARLMRNIARAKRLMMRNIVQCLSRKSAEFSDPLVVLVDGRPLTIDPDAWDDLLVDVDVLTRSEAERVTLTEHMRAMLGDPVTPFLERDFVEQALGIADASDYLERWAAQSVFTEHIKPGIIAQVLRERFGALISMGPDGQFYGFGGQPVDPMQALAANGITPVPGGPPGGVPGVPQAVPNPQMPNLPGLGAPGAIPITGLEG